MFYLSKGVLEIEVRKDSFLAVGPRKTVFKV